MLKDEGIEVHGGKIKNFEEVLFRFSLLDDPIRDRHQVV
jgi:hypothetical protein